MIRSLIKGRLASAEKDLGEPLDYLRHILDLSLGAFRTYLKIQALTTYRDVAPKEPWHVARIVSVRLHDCGTCVQTVVTQAKRDGAAVEILKAVVAGKPEALPEELADVY